MERSRWEGGEVEIECGLPSTIMARPTYYIAGRIAGDPDYLAKFAAAEHALRSCGYEPVNPCVVVPLHDGWTYEQYLTANIKRLLECDGVYALRDWKGSKGATIEVQLALRLGKRVIYQSPIDKHTLLT